MQHSDLCVGIDLGTTNSVIATCFVDGDRIETPVSKIERYTDMSNRSNTRKEKGELLPSCVYYADMKGGHYEPIVGDFAKKVSQTQPFAVARSIKRQMGQPAVNIPGWKSEYPDQRPEEVSARIIRHMTQSLEDYYGEPITDAVITVPASFNPAQREATLRAAELAGLEVRDTDGSYRDDILISEPEAVIYDVLNQVQNGKINLPIEFKSKKRVLVFDIGGGTLDITLHEIIKTSDGGNHFEIRPLATNRFSTVAGDRFDQILADWMYRQYLEEYRAQDAEIAQRIESNPQSAISFLSFAEELKMQVSNRYKDRQNRGNPLSKDTSFDYGGYMPNGYNSENDITLEEFEDILSPLLGCDYTYDDYKRFESIQDENNIIFPILDVLHKAAKKLRIGEVTIDAVILNGGMSRLYLIERRLAEFFQLKPITINDPDKSVAQGAAVYHHYLHQDDKVQELHRMFLEEQTRLEREEGNTALPLPQSAARFGGSHIQSVASVLNEAIYLGLKGGSTYLLADSGAELPYQSPPLLDFSISPGQTRLRIPIKQVSTNKEYRTIASGDINFSKAAKQETSVAIQFLLRKNGTLTLQAWTYSDSLGMDVLERGSVTLDFSTSADAPATAKRGRKALPPTGTRLVVANELSSFKNLIDNLKREKNSGKKRSIVGSLRQRKKIISNCGNPDEFAAPSLKMLQTSGDTYLNMNYLPIARRHSRHWTEEERRALSRYCVSSLGRALVGLSASGPEVTANIEAIKTIGACGIPDDVEKLKPLKTEPRYRSALLYAFGCSGQDAAWICREFQSDVERHYTIQDSLLAVGLIFSGDNHAAFPADAQKTLSTIIHLTADGGLTQNDLVLAVIAIGEICAQAFTVEDSIVQAAKQTMEEIPSKYSAAVVNYSAKARGIAGRLILGAPLSDEDESYLLGLLSESLG